MDLDIHRNGVEMKLVEFWPVEHPVEPMEEDRPIECPKIPQTSAINDENSYDEEETCEIKRRKEKFLAVIDEKDLVSSSGRKSPRRVIRKRPHNHTEMANDSTTTTTTAAVAVAVAATSTATFYKISPLCPFPPSDNNNHKFG